MNKHSILVISVMIAMAMLAVGCNPFSAATGDRARNTPFSVEVRWHAGGAASSRGLINDPLVDSVSVEVLNSGGTGIGSGTLSKVAGYWRGIIQVSQAGLTTFMATAKDEGGVVLYYGEQQQTLSGVNDVVTIAVSLQARGIVTTFTGNGSADGIGSAAGFNIPNDVTTDGTNLYVVDTNNCTIRKIGISSGVVTTLAGTAGVSGSTDGSGSEALFNYPEGIATDGTNLYVADTENCTIRQIVISSGVVTTLAGTAGQSGSADGSGSEARFAYPSGITTDDTNLYVADTWNCTIRQIVISSGVVSTLAGMAEQWGSTDDTGSDARFDNPDGVTTDGTNLYVADASNCTIRQIVISSRVVTTLAGMAGQWGATDGTGSAALFNWPGGITTDDTNLYVADTWNKTIRQILISTGEVTTLAGTCPYSDGVGNAARFLGPRGIATDGANLYVADMDNHTIRQILISTGEVTTLAGTTGEADCTDGPGSEALFNSPNDITTDGTNLYVADTGNNLIRRIVISSGYVSRLAGMPGYPGSHDGQPGLANFNDPRGITTDGTTLYVADTGNHTIRRIVISSGYVSTLAGTAGESGSADGPGGSVARFCNPQGITTDGTTLYVADTGNHTIRQIVISTAEVTTLAGMAGSSGSTDGTGSAARFNGPGSITTDGTILYVSDSNNCTIRKIIISTAEVTTLAGMAGQSGVTDGTGNAARFNMPWGIAMAGANLYVADYYNCTIRKIE